MKFFHTFYTVYDNVGKYIDYGIYQSTHEMYPKFNELHDNLTLSEKPYRVAISDIKEVTQEEYYVNLTEEEEINVDTQYVSSILSGIKIISQSEMEALGLTNERIEEVQDAINESLNTSVDFDVLIVRFVSSVIKQYAEIKTLTPPRSYYERFNVPYDGSADDKFTHDQMIMAYKVDLAKLADTFDGTIDTLDDNTYSASDMNSAFYRLSELLPGMWN